MASKKKFKKYSLLPLMLLFIGITVFLVILKFFNIYAEPKSSYPQDFELGKVVYFYNNDGIFEYSNDTQNKLVAVNALGYGSPVLSPDNTKFAYYAGDKTYDLYVYDILTKTTRTLVENVRLKSGYLQNPVWDYDSKTLYITLLDGEQNVLYKVSEDGKKQKVLSHRLDDKKSVYWPKVVDSQTLSFNTQLPDTKDIGIIHVDKGTSERYTLDSSAYFYEEVKKLNDSEYLFIGKPGLSSKGVVFKRGIYGLEKITVNSIAQSVELPNNISQGDEFKRIQPISVCGNIIVLGRVVSDKDTYDSFSEKYDELYTYNVQTHAAYPITGSQFNEDISSLYEVSCGVENNSYGYYPVSQYSQDSAKIQIIDLKRSKNLANFDFYPFLPENLKNAISAKCLHPSIASVGGFPNSLYGYVVLSPGGDAHGLTVCKDANSLSGIYRIEGKEVVRIAKPSSNVFQQSFIVLPN